MRNIYITLLLLNSFFFIHCKSGIQSEDSSDISIVYQDNNGKIFAKGFIDEDSLQIGNWEYYQDTFVSRGGKFSKGLMFGRWNYNLKDFNGVIDWDTLTILDSFRVNFPNDFKLAMSQDTVQLFYNDSTVSYILYATHNSVDINIAKQLISQEILADSMTTSNIICRDIVYMNKHSYVMFYDTYNKSHYGMRYFAIMPFHNYNIVLHMVGRDFDRTKYQYFMTIYLGVLNNIFVGKEKLVDFNKVEEVPC